MSAKLKQKSLAGFPWHWCAYLLLRFRGILHHGQPPPVHCTKSFGSISQQSRQNYANNMFSVTLGADLKRRLIVIAGQSGMRCSTVIIPSLKVADLPGIGTK